MKTTLFAAAAILAVSFGAQAADFHVPAHIAESTAAGGCGGGVSHVADLLDEPQPCCNKALGCAQFLATTRVDRRHVLPHT